MRFTATLDNVGFGMLTDTLLSFAKLADKLVLKLEPTQVSIIPICKDGSLSCYAALGTRDLFHDHRLVSKNNNVIALEILSSVIAPAWRGQLPSLGTLITLRLTKRSGVPCLAATAVATNGTLSLTREMPVKAYSSSDANRHGEPTLTSPTVALCAPPLDKLRPVVDRLRNLCRAGGQGRGLCPLALRADSTGSLRVRTHSDAVNASTFFRGLKPGAVAPPPGSSGVAVGAVTVDGRLLARALHCLGMELDSLQLAFIPRSCLLLHACLAGGAGTASLFLSAVSDQGDDAAEEEEAAVAAAAAAGSGASP